MLSSRRSKFLLRIYAIVVLGQNYLFSPAEAVNGVIWSKSKNDFVQIFNIRSFDDVDKQRFSISREIEKHNFNKTQLTLIGFPFANLLNFVPNDTVVTGVHGDMWQALSEMLNFKLQIEKYDGHNFGTRNENGSWSGLLGRIYRKEIYVISGCVITPERLTAIDYTFPTWTASFRFHVKKQVQHHRTWMIELFSCGVWFSIVGLFLVLTLVSFSTHVLNFAGNNPRDSISNLGDHFFYIFSIFCNQGWTPWQLGKRSKILILSICLFAWLVVIAFGSKLIAHVTQKKFHPPFYDLESFYRDSDYTLIVKEDSMAYSVFKTSSEPLYRTIFESGRMIQAERLSEAIERVCSGRYAYLESQGLVEAEEARPCEIVVVGKPYFNSWIAEGIVHGFKYKKSIDLGLLKLFEYGIMQRLKTKWLKKPETIKLSGIFQSIGLDQVSLIFGMLGFAVVLSFVLLLIEYTYWYPNNNARPSYIRYD